MAEKFAVHLPTHAFHFVSDRRFSSLCLAYNLLVDFNIEYTGTICSNRIGLPSVDKEALKERGSTISFETVINNAKIGFTVWKDNSLVSFITTGASTDLVEMKRRISYTIRTIKAPEVVQVFNTNLNGIDKLDQTIHTKYNTEKTGRTKKPYLKIFFGILDIGAAAGYRAKKYFFPKQNYTHQLFLENLQIQLKDLLETQFFAGELHIKKKLNVHGRSCTFCAGLLLSDSELIVEYSNFRNFNFKIYLKKINAN